MTSRALLACLTLLPSLAFAGGGQRPDAAGAVPAAATLDAARETPRVQAAPARKSSAAPRPAADSGVRVELATDPRVVRAGEPTTFTFTLHDATTRAPLTGLRPAAWLAPRAGAEATTGPDCVRKAATFLGGSLTNRPALDLNEYYVLALNDDPTISVVDPRFGFGGSQLLSMVKLESRGEDWALSRDGERLFVSMPETGKLAIAETKRWTVQQNVAIGTRPTRVALQPDDARVWVLHEDGATAIDTRSHAIVSRIAAPSPRDIVISDDSRWAAIAAGHQVTIASTDERKSVRPTVDFSARSLAYSSAARLIYAGDPTSGAVAAIEPSNGRIAARIEVAPGFTQVRVAPGGRYLFLPNPEKSIVQVIDVVSHRIVRTADIADGPDQITFSDRLAYIRRRGSDTVLMLPLDQLATDGTAVSLADFTGGQHALGRGRWSTPADSIVRAPDGIAVLVANPADRAIYYYKEGMAAPMGGFNNYSREPRAVLVVDRSLRERPNSGAYATTLAVDAPGRYDAVFFLDAPRVVTCLALDVAEAAPRATDAGGPSAVAGGLASMESGATQAPRVRVRVEAIAVPEHPKPGEPARVRFRLSDIETREAIGADDVAVLAMRAPGVWQRRADARAMGGGAYEAEIVPPEAGVYYLWITSTAAKLPVNNGQFLVLRVE